MHATAIAQPNIALVKYWGKRDMVKNLPAVGSISMTLLGLETKMSVQIDKMAENDRAYVNGSLSQKLLPRVSLALNRVIGSERDRVIVNSRSNFPIAAGLASSASAFAALTLAAASATKSDLTIQQIARLAGESSGSAARSLYGGFVELANEEKTIQVSQLASHQDWPLSVIVAVTEVGPKSVGSTEAMEISRKTSPFYDEWVNRQHADLSAARQAIHERDFSALAAVSEHSCLKMHSVMWASRPSLVYWNAATLRCMQTIRELQSRDVAVFFTIDAGPQLKAICDPKDAETVLTALRATDGVVEVLRSGLGCGARLIADD